MIKAILATSLLMACSACANLTPPSSLKALKPNTAYWASFDSSRRGSTFVATADGNIVGCSEPSPDVALSLSTGLKGNLKTGGTEISGLDASAVATAAALAGRDNVVLLAREALFRICEQSARGTIDPKDVPRLFQDVFQQTKEIAVAQASAAKSRADEARSQVEIAKASK